MHLKMKKLNIFIFGYFIYKFMISIFFFCRNLIVGSFYFIIYTTCKIKLKTNIIIFATEFCYLDLLLTYFNFYSDLLFSTITVFLFIYIFFVVSGTTISTLNAGPRPLNSASTQEQVNITKQ